MPSCFSFGQQYGRHNACTCIRSTPVPIAVKQASNVNFFIVCTVYNAPVLFSIEPLALKPNLRSGSLHCVVVVFLVVLIDECVCGSGGCSYGVVVVGKCIGVIQRKH